MHELKTAHADENNLVKIRQEKLQALRDKGIAFKNDFKRDSLADELHKLYGSYTQEKLAKEKITVFVAGRIMLSRIMGKASFIQLQDMSGKIQIYLKQEDLSSEIYEEFKKFDLGDIIGVAGFLFKTKTGELSVHAVKIELLTKTLRPLPDKFHGLEDREIKYRKRYIDLIANEDSRKVFLTRIKIINCIRNFLTEHKFLEVETPMLQTLAGGATARPFITHHNALNMQMYLRIAPELYLKRLVVGGFEKVFEINRNFRNEGMSIQHNPEFTMLEFYWAYADYKDLIKITEELFKKIATDVIGSTIVEYQGKTFDFGKPFAQISLKNSILQFNQNLHEDDIASLETARITAKRLGIEIEEGHGLGRIQTSIFEATVEHHLIQPTFITEYPAEVSPLARRNDYNPFVTDRFEFFIAGREIANGFSELNDPEDQAQRFLEQAKTKAAGDEEAMNYDADYIEALEYGLAPTAGEGIGIDRLVMLFTNAASIRDVILFPHLKPKDNQ